MSYQAAPRLPFAKLEEYVRCLQSEEDVEKRRYMSVETTYTVLVSTMAERCKVDRNTIYRWSKDDVPLWAGDRAAIAMGVHPVEIWPEFYEGATCPT